jgi:4-amino-4-deoxy-L-arabinose transferase-like glycosyltransferase
MAGQRESGLGFDETIHVYAAKSILETGKPELPSGEIYDRALFFTKAVALSFKLFGVNELSARLPSIVFGVLSVVLVFFIGRGFGTSAGLIAALLMAFMPFEVGWSRACRMYSMYQFFFLLTLFSFYKGFEPEKVRVNVETLKIEKSSDTHFMVAFFKDLNWTWIVLTGIFTIIALNLQPLILSFLHVLCFFLQFRIPACT